MKLNWFRLYILLCMCILTYTAKAQTTAPMPWFHQQFVGADGAPLVGGLVYTYVSNSSVQHPSYRDSVGTLNQNPIQLDSGGYADIWLDNTAYRICVYDSSNVLQFCKDNITAAPAVLGQTYAQLSGGNVFLGGSQVIAAQGTATAGANADSHSLRLRASFWNGTAGANDDWLFVNKMGGGTNPTATLSITHSGSSGIASFDFSSLGPSKLPTIISPAFTTGGTWTGGPTITSPILALGVGKDGSGFKHIRVAGCTTAAGANSVCNTTVTWVTAFADNTYTAVCNLVNSAVAGAYLSHQGATSAASFVVEISNGPGGGAATGNIDCIGVHD